MKKKLFSPFLLLLAAGILCSAAVPSVADFDDLGAGARAIGMGNSFTAVADNPFGIYYNPAGLGFIRTGQVGADFGKLYYGLDDGSNLTNSFSAVAIPLLKAKLYDASVSSGTPAVKTPQIAVSTASVVDVSTDTAVAVTTTTAAGADTSSGTVKVTYYHHLGTLAFGWRSFSLTDYYQESAYYLSYGRPVANKWAWGVNLKYLQEKYTMNDYLKASPVFQYGKKDSVAAMSADVGVIYNLAPRLFLGAALSDINQPNVGLLEEDKLPYGVRVGMAWKEKDLCWALDGQYRRNQWYYSTGFERFIANVLGLRAGIGLGGHNYFNVAAGFSVTFYRAQLDYVFQYPLSGIKDIAGSHRMSFVFRFGRRVKEEMETGSIEYYYSQLQDEVENVRQRLLQTKNEKENLESILLEEATLRIRERIKAAKAEAARMSTSAPAPAPVRAAPAETHEREPKETRHVVRQGETLQTIAEKYYGASKYWDEIYQTNKDNVGRGGVLKANQVLIIPALSKQDSSGERATPSKSSPIKIDSGVEGQKMIKPEIKTIEHESIGDKVIPIKVITSPGGSIAPAMPGMMTEKVTPVKDELELNMQRKRESPRLSEKPKAAVSRRHLVQSGENLRSIAQKYYNDSNRWKEIYQANRDKVISGQVAPGQEIVIP